MFSAGGSSVNAQVVAYNGQSDGLFRAAVVQSGSPSSLWGVADSAAYQNTWDTLLANTSCSSTANQSTSAQLECVRGLDAGTFRNVTTGTTGATYDGKFLAQKSALVNYQNGQWAKVPFIVGACTDEGRSFSKLGANTTEQLKTSFATVPNATVDELISYCEVTTYDPCTFLADCIPRKTLMIRFWDVPLTLAHFSCRRFRTDCLAHQVHSTSKFALLGVT